MSFITKIKNKGDFCAEEEKIEILQNTAILSAFSIIKLRDKKKKKILLNSLASFPNAIQGVLLNSIHH